MAHIQLFDPDPAFTVDRDTAETGAVTFTMRTAEGTVTLNTGSDEDDAAALARKLEDAAKSLRADILDGWEDMPSEWDGWITQGRDGGYLISLSNRNPAGMPRDGYPTKDIAMYELARMMADTGEFPAAWYQYSSYTTGCDAEVRAFHDAGGDKLLPLPGVRFKTGDLVDMPAEDWRSWIVVGDYGELGLMLHTRGDPDVTLFLESEQDRARVQPWPEDDGD